MCSPTSELSMAAVFDNSDVDRRSGRRWLRRFVNSEFGSRLTTRQPDHLLGRARVLQGCGDYDGRRARAAQDGGAHARHHKLPTLGSMVSCTAHGRCKTDQDRFYTPHHLTCAGCGPWIHDFLVGGENHSAQDHGAGVAPPPPNAHHKPATHHTEAGRARTAHRHDAQSSHSRSLLVCSADSLEALSMAAGGRAARPEDIFNLPQGRGQAVGGAGGGAAAFFRSSRGRTLLSRSIFQRSAVPHRTSGGGHG